MIIEFKDLICIDKKSTNTDSYCVLYTSEVHNPVEPIEFQEESFDICYDLNTTVSGWFEYSDTFNSIEYPSFKNNKSYNLSFSDKEENNYIPLHITRKYVKDRKIVFELEDDVEDDGYIVMEFECTSEIFLYNKQRMIFNEMTKHLFEMLDNRKTIFAKLDEV